MREPLLRKDRVATVELSWDPQCSSEGEMRRQVTTRFAAGVDPLGRHALGGSPCGRHCPYSEPCNTSRSASEPLSQIRPSQSVHQALEPRVAAQQGEGGVDPKPARREVVRDREQRLQPVERLVGLAQEQVASFRVPAMWFHVI